MQGLVTRLLEAYHGQWIYRNLTVDDKISGLIATKGKEQLMQAIDRQMKLGGNGLEESNQWMLQVNIRDLEVMSRKFGMYWLLAVETA